MRRLDCTTCGQTIQVHEQPREFIDPALYVCGQCLQPTVVQPTLLDPERSEVRQYDPAIAELPF
jgi:hypothetical protein